LEKSAHYTLHSKTTPFCPKRRSLGPFFILVFFLIFFLKKKLKKKEGEIGGGWSHPLGQKGGGPATPFLGKGVAPATPDFPPFFFLLEKKKKKNQKWGKTTPFWAKRRRFGRAQNVVVLE
jgi:hypothetical protein